MLSPIEAAQLCAEAAESKKTFDILILDLRRLTYITDYFVICSGSNTTQVSAISEWIGQTLSRNGLRKMEHLRGESREDRLKQHEKHQVPRAKSQINLNQETK